MQKAVFVKIKRQLVMRCVGRDRLIVSV